MTGNILLFGIGLALLIKGADWLVDGASYIARKLNIPHFIIGLVIVGIGTSIPEFSVSVLANLLGREGIALGTVIGSNTFNILFILGISAFLFPISLEKHWVNRDLWWNLLAILIAALLIFLPIGGKDGLAGELTRAEGFLMLLIFAAWLYFAVLKTNHVAEHERKHRHIAFPMAFVLITAGFIGVILGGKWVVDGSVEIARAFGWSTKLIGLTIVGVGTSLPELAATLTAAYKREPGIAVGGIIGSNIFDFLMILGVAAFLNPISFPNEFLPDMAVTLLASFLLIGSMFVGKKYHLKHWQGLTFVAVYIIYLVYLFGRG